MRRRVMVLVSPQKVGLLVCSMALIMTFVVIRPGIRETIVPLTEIVSGKIVYIDPGHGGRDPGCASPGGLTEKDLVLDVSSRLRELFLRSAMDARLTRSDDTEVLPAEWSGTGWKRAELSNRVQQASKGKADIFLSIHANSFPESVWSGAQTFYYSGQDESKSLAISIQNMLVTKLGPNRRMAKAGDFWVLSKAQMPAAMVEIGFLSNPREADLLATAEYRNKVAEAIFEGVIQYVVETKTRQRALLDPEAAQEIISAQRPIRERGEVILYFPGPTNQDDYLVAELREIPELLNSDTLSEEQILALTLEQLIQGPGSGSILYPLLPAGTTVQQIKIEPGGTITVNLGSEVEKAFQGGGHAEEIVVYGIVNTISELFPGRQVYLHIAGQTEASIGGHVWLDRPLSRRNDLICPK